MTFGREELALLLEVLEGDARSDAFDSCFSRVAARAEFEVLLLLSFATGLRPQSFLQGSRGDFARLGDVKVFQLERGKYARRR